MLEKDELLGEVERLSVGERLRLVENWLEEEEEEGRARGLGGDFKASRAFFSLKLKSFMRLWRGNSSEE